MDLLDDELTPRSGHGDADRATPDVSRSNTGYDLLDYLDDLDDDSDDDDSSAPPDEQEGQSQQPVSGGATAAKSSEPEDSADDDDDSSEYIDVTLPWTAIAAEVAVLDSPGDESTGESSEPEQRTNATSDSHDGSGTAAKTSPARATHTLAPPDAWAIDLAALLVPSAAGTLEKFHLLKWRETLQLHTLLAATRFHATRLAGDDRALFENFHRAFPHEMVTKARFVSVLRSVLGIDDGVRRKLEREETALCRHLDAMQYAFERAASDGVECVNWRVLLAALHMFQEPLLGMREHCAWLFSAYASSGYLELRDRDAVAGGHVTTILTHFLRSHTAARFVSERIRRAIDLMPAAPGASARMTYRRFKEMLAQPPVAALFARVTPHTTVLDELASPLYRDFVFVRRKREHDVRTIKRLRFLHATRALRHCFFIWTQLARVRKRTRALMTESCGKMARVQRMWAFIKLKRYAIASIAAIEIQRTFRGYLGRQLGEHQWRRVQAAIRVQGAFRMRSHFVRFLRDVRKRNQRAVRIQRVYRGRLGRIAVRQRVLAFYVSEMARLQLERDAFRAYVREVMATRLQRFFRALVRDKVEQRRLEDAFARRKIEREMEENAQNAVRAARRHRHDVTAAFDKLRDEHEALRKRKQIDALEKQKVLRLRRQRQWDAFKRARDERKEELKQQSAAAYARLESEWRTRIAERAQKRKLFVSQVLLLEEPGEWKALQQTLQRAIRERKKELLARYKSSGVSVPAREVDARAQLEIVEEEEAKERQQAEDDWRQAEAEFIHQLADEEEARATKESADERVRREKSAVRVQSAFRMFAARQLLRREIRALFAKEFDPKRQVAVYRNTFSGARSLRKPFGLGSEELEYPDQWHLLEDQVSGERFFYNPLRMQQSWDVPDDCRLCASCPSATFATLWLAHDDAFSCQSCFEQQTAAEDVSTAAERAVPYDGSRPNGY